MRQQSLYERLALNRDKKEVMRRLANEGQTIEKPTDLLRSSFTLEFLGLEEKSVYNEIDLETRILDNLQKFLLEIGKGFLFEVRQKRFTFDEDHYFLDLVLCNRSIIGGTYFARKCQNLRRAIRTLFA
jgi:predicted nuclease of restriction endonuclease-like (RecB) superfamily